MHDACDLKAQLAGALLYGLDYPRFNLKASDLAATALLLESIATEGQTDLLSVASETCLRCPQLSYCQVGPLVKDSQSNTNLAGFSLPEQNPPKQKTNLFSGLTNKLSIALTAFLAVFRFWEPVAIA